MHSHRTTLGRVAARRPLSPVLIAALSALLLQCRGARDTERPGKEVRTFRLTHPLPESGERGVLPGADQNHADLVAKLGAMARQPNVVGVLVEVSEFEGAWARAADLSDALRALRNAHKTVHCHLETTDNAGYALLARSCDRISITPSGTLDLVGVSLDAVYARKLLENLGLHAELLQAGRFKGAADPLTRDDMPPEVRQTLSAIVDDLQGNLIDAVAEGRKLPKERVRALLDQGPFGAAAAKEAGLVDEVEFDDAARAQVKKTAAADRVAQEFPPRGREPKGLFDLIGTLLASKSNEPTSGPRIALINLDGTIVRGGPSSLRGASAEAFVNILHEFAETKDVKAIVLRINSPGGSALASDLMWHAVRRAVKRKPVIVSLGDMCASGGYYVASAASEIFAQDQTLVGSIGVVGGKINAEELARRIGVRVEHLALSKRAGWTSPLRAWSAPERGAIERLIEQTYEQFLSRVTEGRGITRAALEPYAEGRLMTARRAREGHLVDRSGGLTAALARAAEQGHLPENPPVQVWPGRPTVFQALSELEGGAQGHATWPDSALRALLASLPRAAVPPVVDALLDDAGAVLVSPYVVSLH